jgi:hypothetical protein
VGISKSTSNLALSQEAIDILISKRRGEVAELAFMHKVISMGFRVAKPWGDSDPFDFIVCHQRWLWRVQVKSLYTKRIGYYVNNCGTNGEAYTPDQVDYLVAYLGPEDLWYVIPVKLLNGRNRVYLSPWTRRQSEFKKYVDAWCLLRGEEPPEAEPPGCRRKPKHPLTAQNVKSSADNEPQKTDD